MPLPAPPYGLSANIPEYQTAKTLPTRSALRHVQEFNLREFIRPYADNPNLTQQPADLDLETVFAHERLTHDILGHEQLVERYADLYGSSPIPPFGIGSEAYLGHLFGIGEWVLLSNSRGECSLWEKETSPRVPWLEDGFLPYVVAVTAVDKFAEAKKRPEVQQIVQTFKYAAMDFDDDDVAVLFAEFAEGGWPVASVISHGDYGTEVLFRVNARTKRAWKAACSTLGDRMAPLVPPRQFKSSIPALLPCLHYRQRLVYLAPP